MELLRFSIFAIAVLWVLWFAGGGPAGGRTKDPFIDPPPPLGTGETYAIGKTGKTTTNAPEPVKTAEGSVFENKVSFYEDEYDYCRY